MASLKQWSVAAGARKALKRTRNAAEFADHVEDGLEVARTVDRGKDIANDDVDLEDRAKDRLERKVSRIYLTNGIDEEEVREQFFDTVEM